MDNARIEKKMLELAEFLGYEFNDLTYLKKAMNCTRIHRNGDGGNRDNCENSALSTLGDAVLKLVLTDYYFEQDDDCGSITKNRIDSEKNLQLKGLCDKSGLIRFAYNEFHFNDEENIPDHEKPRAGQHDLYVEAVIGAVYKDRGYDYAKSWTVKLFEKYTDLLNGE